MKKNCFKKTIITSVLILSLSGAIINYQANVNTAFAAQKYAKPAKDIPVNGEWVVDPWHTNVNFTIQHMGISLVRGRFDDVKGTLHVDQNNLNDSSVQFIIQTAGINTNVKMRDDDLRSPNYFDAVKYPTITFQSTRIEKSNGRTKTQYIAFGNLTIHGVTKAIELPFDVNGPIHDTFGGVRFGVLIHTLLHRLDYGVGPNNKMSNGLPDIGNDVDIDISLEAVPPKK